MEMKLYLKNNTVSQAMNNEFATDTLMLLTQIFFSQKLLLYYCYTFGLFKI